MGKQYVPFPLELFTLCLIIEAIIKTLSVVPNICRGNVQDNYVYNI